MLYELHCSIFQTSRSTDKEIAIDMAQLIQYEPGVDTVYRRWYSLCNVGSKMQYYYMLSCSKFLQHRRSRSLSDLPHYLFKISAWENPVSFITRVCYRRAIPVLVVHDACWVCIIAYVNLKGVKNKKEKRLYVLREPD